VTKLPISVTCFYWDGQTALHESILMTLTKKTWLYFSPARRQIDLLDWCHFICHKLLELSTKYSGLGVEKNGTKFRHFEGARPVCSK